MFDDIIKKEELELDTLDLKQVNHKSVRIGSFNTLMKIKIDNFKNEYVRQHSNLSKEELIIELKILDEFKDFVENN